MNANRTQKPTRLTRRVLEHLPKGWRVRDTGTIGLFAERGQRDRVALKVQVDLHQPGRPVRTIRQTLGYWGGPDGLDLDVARARAAALVVEVRGGRDPRVVAPVDPSRIWTVSEAFDAYIKDTLKSRPGSKNSMDQMKARRDFYLKGWLDRPLNEITALDCRNLHDRIIADVQERNRAGRNTGARIANMVVKDVRSIWKLASQVFAALPPVCPAASVRLASERKAHGCIALADFPAWKRAIDDLESPVRRGMHRVSLFAGLRPSNAMGLKRAWVDLEGGWIRFPGAVMKNRQPFDCPLSGALISLLREALRVGTDHKATSEWVFPSSSKSGHVETRRERDLPADWVGHSLRHSWSNAAELAEVPGDVRQMLLGQRVGGVRGTYLSPGQLGERLRAAQEQVSLKLMALFSGKV